MSEHVRALVAEAGGSFMFFFIGAGAIVAGVAGGGGGGGIGSIALAHGLALAVAVSTFGALAAGAALRYAFDFAPTALDKTHIGTPGLGAGVTVPVAIVVEALLTLFLVWVVFGTAVSPLAPRIGGLGIGFAVAADIFVGGGITGAAMNPARWFGPAVAAGFYDNWFVYWIGPLVGAAVAGLSYRYVFAPPEGRAPAIVSAPPV